MFAFAESCVARGEIGRATQRRADFGTLPTDLIFVHLKAYLVHRSARRIEPPQPIELTAPYAHQTSRPCSHRHAVVLEGCAAICGDVRTRIALSMAIYRTKPIIYINVDTFEKVVVKHRPWTAEVARAYMNRLETGGLMPLRFFVLHPIDPLSHRSIF